MVHSWAMGRDMILDVVFYSSERGNEPVRDWLKDMGTEDRKIIGGDIQTVQFRWPVGMPLVRPMGTGLWEVRSHVSDGCIARVFFIVDDGEMVLLHGIIKKSRTTPAADLKIARGRSDKWNE